MYSFGQLLYEMATGRPLSAATCDEFPAAVSPDLSEYCVMKCTVDPGGGPGCPGPPCPQDFFKIMQFSGNFKGKTPILSKFWA